MICGLKVSVIILLAVATTDQIAAKSLTDDTICLESASDFRKLGGCECYNNDECWENPPNDLTFYLLVVSLLKKECVVYMLNECEKDLVVKRNAEAVQDYNPNEKSDKAFKLWLEEKEKQESSS